MWVVSCYAHEQPSPETWQFLAAAADLSGPPSALGHDPTPSFRQLVLEDARSRDQLLSWLRAITGAVIHVDQSHRLEDSDFEEADLVGVFARARDVDVVSNASDVLVGTGPCPVCGLEDTFDVRQQGRFVMDEHVPEGDALNLPGGGLAISERMVATLTMAGVRGFEWEDMIDGGSGAPSAHWRQLVATTTVLVPCPEHTVVHGDPFCPTCGRAHGRVDGHVWVRSDAVGDTDLISRHPGGRTMFYLGRRAFDALREFADLRPTDVLRICRH